MSGGVLMTPTPATPASRRQGGGPESGGLRADAGADELRDLIAGNLVRQHSPLMSPLVWDLAHIANQEELWLLRNVGGREPMHPEIDPLYDAFEHPRAARPTLPLLPPAEARGYAREVRGRVMDLL